MARFRLYNLDVWGNAKEGYDINQWFDAGTYEIADGVDLVEFLIDEGLRKSPR